MSKKDFKGGLQSLIGEGNSIATDNTNINLPNPPTESVTKAEERATFIIPVDLHDQLKAIAYWERLRIKDVVTSALSEYIEKYINDNGIIQPLPEDKRKNKK